MATRATGRTSRALNRVSHATITDLGLLGCGALLYALAMPPWGWAAAGWITLAPFFFVLRRVSVARAAGYGALFGTLMCAGVAYWLYPAIHSYFAASAPFSIALTGAAYLFFVGMYVAAVGAGCAIVMRRAPRAIRWTALPALWVAGEYARSSLFAGFSWCLLGYSQYRHPNLIQHADLTGVYGVSFMLACSGYAIADAFVQALESLRTTARPVFALKPVCVLGAAIALVAAYGAVRVNQYSAPARESIRVALVVREMPAQDRFLRIRYLRSLLGYVEATRAGVARGAADLVIWPEFASGLYVDRDPSVRLQLARLAEETDSALLLGAPRMDDSGGAARYYNSAFLLSPEGRMGGSYDKIRLLPFAEYRPFGLPRMISRPSDYPDEFTAGQRSTVFSIAPASFGVMICYESTYPQFARRLAAGGAQFLVNISNDVWLSGSGGDAAAEQHFAMATMRAVENKRALARATMAGVSGFVDPAGRPYRISAGVPAVLQARLALEKSRTVYTRFGDWFALACVLYSCLSLAWCLRGSAEDRR